MYEENLVSVDGQGGCVDERGRVDGAQRKGAKTLGGSVELADMIFIAMHKTGMDTKSPEMTGKGEEFDVVEVVMGLYETEKARELGIKPGVHNDDDHGHVTDPQELGTRTVGCGHDKVRPNVLQREFGVELSENDQHLVGRFVAAGAPIESYSGNHVSGARAVENHMVGKTLDTVAVLNEGKPAFDHDIWVPVEMANEMAEAMKSLGGSYTKVGQQLTRENVAAWSAKLYRGTLTDLGGPADKVIEIGKAA